ncbi:MAG: phasin family protein [Sterolibacterium sp.]|jgi:phasin family protein|nr:phasin family protein [Sterolibacterium sp.]
MNTEQLGDLQRKNMAAGMKLAQMSLENSQRIVELQVELAKKLVQDCIDSGQAMTSARDPQKVIALQTQYIQESAQTIMDAARQMAECSNASCTELAKLYTEQFSFGQKDALSSTQSMLSAWPGYNSNTTDMLSQAMSAMTQAFEQFTQASATTFAPPQKASTSGANGNNGTSGTRKRSAS